MVWAGQRKRKYYTTLTWVSARRKLTSTDEGEFDVSRAELFEALGHHTRIGILQALEERPMTFSELKRKTGIESSGLLSFHLGKLTHLVTPNQDGAYALTEQGKEAVRMIGITRSGGSEERTVKVRNPGRSRYLVVIGVLLALVIALGSVAIYQQNQLGPLLGAVQTHDSVVVYGTLMGGGTNWVAGITPTSHSSKIVFTSSSGSNTTAVPNAAGQYWVTLLGGQKYTVTVYWEAALSCSTACMPIINSTGFSVTASSISPCPAGGCQSQSQVTGYGTPWNTVLVDAQSPNGTNAVGSGRCTGNVVDVYSTTGSYNYDLSC
jgi:DNA-binding HxlR family transcriptional regulator